MVYGHPTHAAADGAFFLQNFLTSVKQPPDEAPPMQYHHHQHQGFSGLAPGGFNLGGGFNGFVAGFGVPAEMHAGSGAAAAAAAVPAGTAAALGRPGGGSGFLYNLLTAQDATAVQQRSAFASSAEANAAAAAAAAAPAVVGGMPGPSAAAILMNEEFPRRSNSLGHAPPMRRGSAVLQAPLSHAAAAAAALGAIRPSSVPRGLKAAAVSADAAACSSSSPSTTFSSEEPLDLSSTMRMAHEPISDAESSMGSPPEHQPMLRTILSQAAQHYQSQVQPVQLAKKTVMVAQSHVSDWLRKGSELVQTNATLFSSLDRPVQAGLLCRAWPRILQLYMLENSFHFAVTPHSGDQQAPAAAACTRGRLPTKKFADDLQRLIGLAAAVPFDNMTYNLLRLAAIFKAESVQELHLQEVQEEIMKHVLRHLEMKGIARHFKDAVAVLQAVSETDKEMLENLFCRHLGAISVDDFIRAKLGC